jgi:hypothetical protein
VEKKGRTRSKNCVFILLLFLFSFALRFSVLGPYLSLACIPLPLQSCFFLLGLLLSSTATSHCRGRVLVLLFLCVSLPVGEDLINSLSPSSVSLPFPGAFFSRFFFCVCMCLSAALSDRTPEEYTWTKIITSTKVFVDAQRGNSSFRYFRETTRIKNKGQGAFRR